MAMRAPLIYLPCPSLFLAPKYFYHIVTLNTAEKKQHSHFRPKEGNAQWIVGRENNATGYLLTCDDFIRMVPDWGFLILYATPPQQIVSWSDGFLIFVCQDFVCSACLVCLLLLYWGQVHPLCETAMRCLIIIITAALSHSSRHNTERTRHGKAMISF